VRVLCVREQRGQLPPEPPTGCRCFGACTGAGAVVVGAMTFGALVVVGVTTFGALVVGAAAVARAFVTAVLRFGLAFFARAFVAVRLLGGVLVAGAGAALGAAEGATGAVVPDDAPLALGTSAKVR
jgi:hypothetical protein